jgi:hypothetical protein
MWAHKKMTARINILKQVDQFKDSDEQIQKYMCVVYPWTKRGASTISSTLPSAGRVSLAIEKYSWSVLTAWSRSNRSLMRRRSPGCNAASTYSSLLVLSGWPALTALMRRRSPGCNAASTYSSLLVLSGWPALTAGSYHCMCRKSCVTDLAILLLQSSMCNCALQGLFCYSFNKQGRKKGTGGPQGHSAECPKFWTKQWSIYTYHISCLCVYTRTLAKTLLCLSRNNHSLAHFISPTPCTLGQAQSTSDRLFFLHQASFVLPFSVEERAVSIRRDP